MKYQELHYKKKVEALRHRFAGTRDFFEFFRMVYRCEKARRKLWHDFLDRNNDSIYHPESMRLSNRWNYAHWIASGIYHMGTDQHKERFIQITQEVSEP